ncbi:MAG TPA: hypothetical protein VGN05_04810 [Parvibaculum sp.]|jgi:UDPglucose--hexose-1-phosphate uridylyltransferase
MTLFVHRHVKADGRELLLCGHAPHGGLPGPELEPASGASAHLRWHPLRGEWVAYAGARQARTFLPQAAECPLCPAQTGRVGEIPFSDFDIAVFENRFPAFTGDAVAPEAVEGLMLAPATGRCEVVVYSPDHGSSLGMLSDERLALLIEVWGARIGALRDMGFAAVLPFENRGEEIGVTLLHPHGQIYAFSFVPAQIARAAEAQAVAPVIAQLIDALDPSLVLRDGEAMLSFVPPFAMYPYEVWLAPRRRVPSPDKLTAEECAELGAAMGDAVRRLDALFGKPMPYILTVQTAPEGFDDTFHMTIEIHPFRRDSNKLKYLAGVEQGSGVFLVDVMPDEAARALKAALP